MVRRRPNGFTLIELLIVIGVIFVLATVTATHLIRASHRAKRSETRTFISKLELAISMYRIDTGEYPSDEQGSASLRRALDPGKDDPVRETPGWKGPYLEFRDNEVNSAGQLVDPWHRGKEDTIHIYTYRANLDNDPSTFPPFHNTTSFDIYSKGSDGKTGVDEKEASEPQDGNYCLNDVDDDKDGMTDELSSSKDKNGYLEDDINNW